MAFPKPPEKLILPYEEYQRRRIIFPEGDASDREVYEELRQNATTEIHLKAKSGDVKYNFDRFYKRGIGNIIPGLEELNVTGVHNVGGMGFLYLASLRPDGCAHLKHPGIEKQKITDDFNELPWKDFSEKYRVTFSDTLYLVKLLLLNRKPERTPEGTREYEERFIREGNVMVEIDSPYIPKAIYANKNMIALKFIPFTIPIRLLKPNDRTLEQRLIIGENMIRIFADLNKKREAEGLPPLHHRDITGTNIIVSKPPIPDLNAYGVDWGSVSDPKKPLFSQTKKSTLVTGGSLVGTPAYVPPEVLRLGDLKVYTTDVYSLGVVLYELMTGTLPFNGNFNEIMHKITTWNDGKGPTPPRTLDSRIPLSLSNEIMKAISLNPRDRHVDVIEFYEAVRRVRESISFPISARGAVSTEPIKGLPTLVISEEKRIEEENKRRTKRGKELVKRGLKENLIKEGEVAGEEQQTMVIGGADEAKTEPNQTYRDQFTGKRAIEERLRKEEGNKDNYS